MGYNYDMSNVVWIIVAIAFILNAVALFLLFKRLPRTKIEEMEWMPPFEKNVDPLFAEPVSPKDVFEMSDNVADFINKIPPQ